jgi:hypothetical protein
MIWRIIGAGLALMLTSAVAGEPDPEDARVIALIRSMSATAAALRIDGDDRDWRGLPVITCAPPAGIPPNLAVVAVGVAPTSSALTVSVRTAAPLPRRAGALWLSLSDQAGDVDHCSIGLDPEGRHWIDWHRPGRRDVRVRARPGTMPVAFGAVTEIRIPWSALAALAPADGKDHPFAAAVRERRPIAVRAATWDERPATAGGVTAVRADPGLRGASYALVDDPLLDPPEGSLQNIEVATCRLPMTGTWFINLGAFGSFSHGDTWAWDFVQIDRSGRSAPPGVTDPARWLGWDAPLLAPLAGTVVRVRQDGADRPAQPIRPGDHLPPETANSVAISTAMTNGVLVEVVHLRRGSAAVRVGDTVAAGAAIGRVGNSGFSTRPHVHLHGYHGSIQGTAPLWLTGVVVSLNPGDCPFARRPAAWLPVAGRLVRPDDAAGPRPGPATAP